MDLQSLEIKKKNKKIDAVLASTHDELDLGWKHLKDENIEYLSRQDLACESSLNLIGNELTFRCLLYIRNMNFNSLESLHLNFNSIGRKGCKLLVQKLPRNLQTLSLDDCEIDDYAICHLSKASWKQLKILSINQNIILGTNIGTLMRMQASKIEIVEIAYNPILLPACLKLGFPEASFGAKRFIQYKI